MQQNLCSRGSGLFGNKYDKFFQLNDSIYI
jgi:hypothetical protein